MERLAVFVYGKAFRGRKSGAPGIDLELDMDGVRYAIAVKSGPNWGNSRQIEKMKNDFTQYRRIAATSGGKMRVECINGCCYGKTRTPNQPGYTKLCGQSFWAFISGDEELYVEIIEPLGYTAAERTLEFQKSYAQILNLFTQEFLGKYCIDGIIQWERIVRLDSSKA